MHRHNLTLVVVAGGIRNHRSSDFWPALNSTLRTRIARRHRTRELQRQNPLLTTSSCLSGRLPSLQWYRQLARKQGTRARTGRGLTAGQTFVRATSPRRWYKGRRLGSSRGPPPKIHSLSANEHHFDCVFLGRYESGAAQVKRGSHQPASCPPLQTAA